jgi:hypothetical protein
MLTEDDLVKTRHAPASADGVACCERAFSCRHIAIPLSSSSCRHHRLLSPASTAGTLLCRLVVAVAKTVIPDQGAFAAAATFGRGSGYPLPGLSRPQQGAGCFDQNERVAVSLAYTLVASLVKVLLPISWNPPSGTRHWLIRGMRPRWSEFGTRNDGVGPEVPKPVLTRFETLDDRVSGRNGMFRGMLARR